MEVRTEVGSDSSAVIVAVWVAALLGPLLILASVSTFGQGASTAGGSVGPFLLVGGYLVTGLGFAVAGVLVIRWLARARAVSRGSAAHRLSPGLAAASWFIPIGNLWLPFLVVTDVARASSPAAGRSSLDGRIRWWWTCWLASWLASWLGWLGFAATLSMPGLARAVLGLFLALYTVLLIAAAWLFISIVRQIAAWQNQLAEPNAVGVVAESSVVRPGLTSEPRAVAEPGPTRVHPAPRPGTSAPASMPSTPVVERGGRAPELETDRRTIWRAGVAGALVAALAIAIGLIVTGGAPLSRSVEPRLAAPAAAPSGARQISAMSVGSSATHLLALSPDGRRLYTDGRDGLEMFDTASSSVVNTVFIQPSAKEKRIFEMTAVAVSPDGRRVYVAGSEGLYTTAEVERYTGAVVVLDATSLEELARIPIGPGPRGMAFSPDGRSLYVSDDGSRVVDDTDNTIAVIDTATNTATHIPVRHDVWAMDLAPDGRHLLVSGIEIVRRGSTSIIDTATGSLVSSIPLDGQCLAVAADYSYVSDLHQIRAIDTRTLADLGAIELPHNLAAQTIAPDSLPIGDLVVSPNGRYLFVGRDDSWSHLVTVIDTASRRVIEEIPVSAKPEELVLSADGRRLYVAGGAIMRASVMTVDVSPHS